jgi:hypothetical protein
MRRVAIVCVAAAAVATVCVALTPALAHEVRISRTCSDYSNQADAQRAKDTRDADGDGIYCEDLPCPCLKPGEGAPSPDQGGDNGCEQPSRTVTVPLSRARYPEATLHFAVAWGQGVPRRYTIARNRADANRKEWQPYVPSGLDADHDGKKDDRDEVPMAFTREGGRKAANGLSASHIAYVDASDNRGAGSYIGGQLSDYCNGTRFRIRLYGNRTRTAVIVVAFRDGHRVHQVVKRH